MDTSSGDNCIGAEFPHMENIPSQFFYVTIEEEVKVNLHNRIQMTRVLTLPYPIQNEKKVVSLGIL